LKKSPFTNLLSKVHVSPYRDSIEPITSNLVPTTRMKQYNANLPQTLEVLVEDNRLFSINGWLSPHGVLYACRWRQHRNISLALDMASEAQMERAGYIKLTNMKWLVENRYCTGNITQKQIDTIANWFALNELSIQTFEKLKLNWINDEI
jgi:hypothetical protein